MGNSQTRPAPPRLASFLKNNNNNNKFVFKIFNYIKINIFINNKIIIFFITYFINFFIIIYILKIVK